jgi:hypothetical protein
MRTVSGHNPVSLDIGFENIDSDEGAIGCKIVGESGGNS